MCVPHLLLIDSLRERRSWLVDARMRRDRYELVDAGPGDGPGLASFGEILERRARGCVPGRVSAVGINEDVGIDRDHAPRPS